MPAAVSIGNERGYIIPIGGGEDKEAHPVILQRFVEIAGGKDANIVIVPTASRLGDTGSIYERIFSRLGTGASGRSPRDQQALLAHHW